MFIQWILALLPAAALISLLALLRQIPQVGFSVSGTHSKPLLARQSDQKGDQAPIPVRNLLTRERVL